MVNISDLFIFILSEYVFSTDEAMTGAAPICVDETGTVKFLNFRTPENIAVIYLKFKQRGQTLGNFTKKVQMK